MKKILLFLLLVASGFFSAAQSVNFGIKGGLNVSNFPSSFNNGSTVVTTSNAGFHAGVFADFGLGSFSIQPAVLYTTKGGQIDMSATGYTFNIHENITFGYIEVPLNLLYHIPLSFGKIFVGGGPYIDYGVTGTEKDVLSQNGVVIGTGSSNITYGNSDGNFRNPNFGINILAGLMINKGLSLSVGYAFGLSNLYTTSGNTGKNNVFDVSLAYSLL